MNRQQIEVALFATLEDGRLTSSERRALKAPLGQLSISDRGALRASLFDRLRERGQVGAGELSWLEDVLKLLRGAAARAVPPAIVRFGPEAPMVETRA